jgi:hypothetical protein
MSMGTYSTFAGKHDSSLWTSRGSKEVRHAQNSPRVFSLANVRWAARLDLDPDFH